MYRQVKGAVNLSFPAEACILIPMETFISPFLDLFSFGHTARTAVAAIVSVIALAVCAVIIHVAGRLILKTVVLKAVRSTPTRWDDILFDRGVFTRLAHILPALAVFLLLPVFFPVSGDALAFVRRLVIAWMIASAAGAIASTLDAVNDIYKTIDAEVARRRPIKGYLQMIKIFVGIIAVVLVITGIMNVSPVGILSGLGAMSAVLMLVFKDPIMGFVSSMQLSANDMVRIGDWIEMPKYGADGAVIDITLQSITVSNWDNTITTIPIYALISDSFKNWRGMSESEGRRIKRAINLDMRTVRFLTEDDIERFSKMLLLNGYLTHKVAEIESHNRSLDLDVSDRVSGRHLTNLGTFRAYVSAYLDEHPMVQKNLIHMVRYLEPTSQGLPFEIYLFSSDKNWVNFEGIQADIMDHLLSVLPEFGLRVFQQPSGWDLQALGGHLR